MIKVETVGAVYIYISNFIRKIEGKKAFTLGTKIYGQLEIIAHLICEKICKLSYVNYVHSFGLYFVARG